jgi:hypothetical protein
LRKIQESEKLLISGIQVNSEPQIRNGQKLTEGNGMPLTNCTSPANANEREQVIPLLDKVKLKTLKRGRPRKRIKVLAADKGDNSKQKPADLRKRGIRPQIPKRVWKTKKNKVRPIKISVPRFQQERCFA